MDKTSSYALSIVLVASSFHTHVNAQSLFPDREGQRWFPYTAERLEAEQIRAIGPCIGYSEHFETLWHEGTEHPHVWEPSTRINDPYSVEEIHDARTRATEIFGHAVGDNNVKSFLTPTNYHTMIASMGDSWSLPFEEVRSYLRHYAIQGPNGEESIMITREIFIGANNPHYTLSGVIDIGNNGILDYVLTANDSNGDQVSTETAIRDFFEGSANLEEILRTNPACS